jgi:streptogramin lyase
MRIPVDKEESGMRKGRGPTSAYAARLRDRLGTPRPGNLKVAITTALAGTCLAAAGPAAADIRIVQVGPAQQGAGGDLTQGPGGRVWGLDGGYGCGQKPIPSPTSGAKCGVFSVKLDGSDYRFYEIPPEIVDAPVPGDLPTNEQLAPFPPLYAQFFNPLGPFCGCPGSPPGVPGRPTGIAPFDITPDADGNIWFTNTALGVPGIIKMKPTGASTATWTFYSMASLTAAAGRTDNLTNPPRPTYGGWPLAPIPFDIEAGPDGRIYFGVQDTWPAAVHTTGAGNRKRESWIGRFEPQDPVGTLFTWGVSGMMSPIAEGPDGNMWFKTFQLFNSQADDAGIGRIDVRNGSKKFWQLPPNTDMINACCTAFTSDFIAFGADGDVWYTREFKKGIGRFRPRDGSFTEYTEGYPADMTSSYGIAFGNDGMLYQLDGTNRRGNVIQFDPKRGEVTQVIVNPRPNFPGSLKKMADGTLWFTDHTRANLQKVVGIPDMRRGHKWAPKVHGVRLTPKRFHAAKGSARSSADGATLRYRLSEPASVRLRVERASKGRTWSRIGSIRRAGKRGANSLRIGGSVGGKLLAKGSYRLVLTATDRPGNRSGARVVGFRVL